MGTQLQGTEHWGQGHGQGCAHTTGEGHAHSPSHGGQARGPRGHCGMGLGDVLGAPPGDGSWTEAQLCPETAEGGCLHGGRHVSQPETMGQGPAGLGGPCQGLKQGLPNHPGSPEPRSPGQADEEEAAALTTSSERGFWGPAGKAGLETTWGSGPSHGAWPDCPVAPLPIWEGGEPSNMAPLCERCWEGQGAPGGMARGSCPRPWLCLGGRGWRLALQGRKDLQGVGVPAAAQPPSSLWAHGPRSPQAVANRESPVQLCLGSEGHHRASLPWELCPPKARRLRGEESGGRPQAGPEESCLGGWEAQSPPALRCAGGPWPGAEAWGCGDQAGSRTRNGARPGTDGSCTRSSQVGTGRLEGRGGEEGERPVSHCRTGRQAGTWEQGRWAAGAAQHPRQN